MLLKEKDLKLKEVINIHTAEKLGYIKDVEISFQDGLIETVIIPKKPYFLNMFFKNRCFVIPWNSIVKIGRELVLVDYRHTN